MVSIMANSSSQKDDNSVDELPISVLLRDGWSELADDFADFGANPMQPGAFSSGLLESEMMALITFTRRVMGAKMLVDDLRGAFAATPGLTHLKVRFENDGDGSFNVQVDLADNNRDAIDLAEHYFLTESAHPRYCSNLANGPQNRGAEFEISVGRLEMETLMSPDECVSFISKRVPSLWHSFRKDRHDIERTQMDRARAEVEAEVREIASRPKAA